MKKLLLAASLMATVTLTSFAGVAITDPQGWNWDSNTYTFTFTESGSYGLEFCWETAYSMQQCTGQTAGPATIHAFGYYYVNGPNAGQMIAGAFVDGNNHSYSDIPSSYFSGYNMDGMYTVDSNLGYLGDFNAGDTIGLWIISSRPDYVYGVGEEALITSSFMTGFANAFEGLCSVCNNVGEYYGDNSYEFFQGHFQADRTFFRFINGVDNPNGQPLPGVIAALAIGGAAFIGKKLKKNVKK